MNGRGEIDGNAKKTEKTARNFLAIDTATDILSVALEAGAETWYFEADAGIRHSQLLMEAIGHLMEKAGLKPDDLSVVCCMAGPGSFTGLRIGFACAKGLSLSLNIPYFPVSSLDCMASRFSVWPGLVLPAIDAKKNAWFCALYWEGKRLCADMDADAEVIACAIGRAFASTPAPNGNDWKKWPALVTGPDAEKLYHILIKTPAFNHKLYFDSGCRSGHAKELLAIAKNMEIGDNNAIDYLLGPDYIRKSDAELELEKRQENA